MGTLLAALTPHRVILGCRIFIALQVTLRLLVFGAGFFYWDDYVLQGRAAQFPLFSADFLLYLHNGHLMPGGFLVTGVLERLAPLDYWPVLFVMLVLQFLATWLTYRLLRSLIGPRPILLGLVALVALTPMSLLPGSWWSAAVNFLPLQICAAITGLLILKATRGGSRWWQVAAVAILVVSLAFFEKSVLLPLVALAVAIAAGPPERGLLEGIRSTVRRQWLYWVLAALVVIAYLVYYLGRAGAQSRPLFDSSGIVILVAETLLRGLVPALVGGPLSYEAVGFGSALADPSVLVTAVALVIVLALVAYGLGQSARSRAAWTLVGVWLLADVLSLVLGRSGFDMVLGLGTSLRYTVDALVIIMVAAAVTLAPPVGQPDSPAASATRAALARQTAAHPRAWATGALAVTAVAIAACIVSHTSLIAPLADNASRSWLMSIRKATAERGQGVSILDGPVPETVYDAIGYPHNLLSSVLAPLRSDIEVTDVIAEPVMFDDAGNLVAATVKGIESFPGPDGDCGWAVREEPVTIPIDGNLFPWEYTLRLRYLAANNATVPVRLGEGETRDISVSEGPHEVLVRLDGNGSSVTVGPYGGPEGICIAQVAVGDLVPAE